MIGESRRARTVRIAVATFGIAAFFYFAFLAGIAVVMRQPPQTFGRIMRHVPGPLMIIVPFEPMWNSARRGKLNVGDQAPDFTLPRSDKSGDVSLSGLQGKPVVLVFGSYT